VGVIEWGEFWSGQESSFNCRKECRELSINLLVCARGWMVGFFLVSLALGCCPINNSGAALFQAILFTSTERISPYRQPTIISVLP